MNTPYGAHTARAVLTFHQWIRLQRMAAIVEQKLRDAVDAVPDAEVGVYLTLTQRAYEEVR